MAGRIREADIAEVRERNRIDEVVGEYVALRNAGGGALKGLCPFHDEKTPSFNVRPTHGTFHCFGCAEGGDVIKFLMKIDHLGFVESVERLADRVGFRLTYEGGGASVQRDRGTRTRMVEAHKAAAEFYAEQLRGPEAELARKYLRERGFDEAAAQRFGCGFAPSGWDKLTKSLLNRGFELSELLKAQLVKEGRQGPIDRFHRRLVWPIKDLGGDVVGFGARRLFDDDPIQAKYLNTSESPIYKKSQVLFGLDLAKREIAKRHQVVVVEGYTDVMAMHAAGVPTAVASSGTAFGEDHMKVLRRLLMDDDAFRGEVVFTFDGDAAGQKAALKAFEGDQTFAGQTYIAVAPDGMDPCELRLAKGDAAVRDLVARRIPLFEFAIKSMLAEYDLDSVDGQVSALQRTVPLVAQIKDRAKRDGYATKLAWWVGWQDADMVVRRVRASAGNGAPVKPGRRAPANGSAPAAGAAEDIPRPAPKDPRFMAQREVLKAALQEPALAGPEYDALPEDAFTHPAYVAVHRAVLKAGGASCGLTGPALIDAASTNLPQGTVRTLLSELSVEPLHAKGTVDIRYVGSMIAAVQENLVGRQTAEIKSRLQRLSPVDAPDEYRALFGDLVALEEYRKALKDQAIGGMD
ncbi:DNA primase [Amycolatopsis acidiphila]|uniref:DNA primase n=1 Tax=Amycolatopsis acidiphila TaxID=715473 RepID=A0A558A6A7_9PSEU|nr:DNA primase [Amycolatopsis acidiphila]TVT19775.1 DNA primase [Amycolatopsis acidiphila]UIJ61858.1 DNA primase [Amycolatopsis acidiphila]GHG57523.1 DNA primase [Amycolatopsis acidiphila]